MDVALQDISKDWHLIVFPLAVIIGLVLAIYVFIYARRRKQIADLIKKDDEIIDEKALEKIKKLKETEEYPFLPARMLTDKEMDIFYILVEELPYFNILSKVNYSAFLKVKEGFNEKLMKGKIKKIYADFLIVKRDFTPVFVIELTDGGKDENLKKLIDKKKKILEHAKIPHLILDINDLPTGEKLVAMVKEKLRL
jgi:hypothetical protein